MLNFPNYQKNANHTHLDVLRQKTHKLTSVGEDVENWKPVHYGGM